MFSTVLTFLTRSSKKKIGIYKLNFFTVISEVFLHKLTELKETWIFFKFKAFLLLCWLAILHFDAMSYFYLYPILKLYCWYFQVHLV